jgi:hypothetical protein
MIQGRRESAPFGKRSRGSLLERLVNVKRNAKTNPNGNARGFALLQLVWILAGAMVIAAAAWHFVDRFQDHDVQFSTPFQAVLLANGSVYFGHLQGYGSHQPVLTEVYYAVTQTNPETKQSANVLIKRGKELHEPDRMYLNPQQILFVEPVGPNSKVAQLIAQAK